MQSYPNFFGDCIQSGPESRDQTVLQSKLDRTAKLYFGPVPKFETRPLTISLVQSGLASLALNLH
jgi:hypothetical protein